MKPKGEECEARIRPFHCGSQFADWKWRNCDQCTKRWSESEQWRCDIERELDHANIDDGTIPQSIALRMDIKALALTWDCPERAVKP